MAEGHKALIFSQFMEVLKLLRIKLDEHHIRYAYLDGSTNNRQEQVDTFQTEPGIPFFLISLKAGGVGLNLTAADYVINQLIATETSFFKALTREDVQTLFS